jgi:hypothetical protein
MNQVALNTEIFSEIFGSKHHPWQLAQNTLYDHKLQIGYHEPSMNIMIFKLYLHFIQLKNIATACGFSWFANNMFKISSNFMNKLLKMIQLHEYDFPQTLLHYFMDLQFKFDIYEKIL